MNPAVGAACRAGMLTFELKEIVEDRAGRPFPFFVTILHRGTPTAPEQFSLQEGTLTQISTHKSSKENGFQEFRDDFLL